MGIRGDIAGAVTRCNGVNPRNLPGGAPVADARAMKAGFGSWLRARRQLLVIGVLLAVLPAAKCVLGTEIVSDAFNEGAIDTSGGDPFRDPKNVQRDIVAARIHAELIDAYFHMGPGRDLDLDASAWMLNVSKDILGFYNLVIEVACEQKIRIGEPCPPKRAGWQASQVRDQVAQQARQHVIEETGEWATRPRENVCSAKGQRNQKALAHFLDYLRFTVAVERAVYETADLLAEGLVAKEAVLAGAELAFVRASDYLKLRKWRRDLDHRTTGLVVKGGAATGTYSAGVVWVALNVIHRYIEDSGCDKAPKKNCPRFDLVSGTSTGAFVAAAADRFASAKCAAERRAMIRTIAEWFTCFALNDMYCAHKRPLTHLVSRKEPLQGVLEFDGLRNILAHELSRAEIQNPSELVLNTVDFRSGRLFALSDQHPRELWQPSDVVDGVLASAVLPLIVEPIRKLPVSPTEGEDAVYLDGGIRSELPVLPLVRRGAERVLIASSGASVLGETSRLAHGVSIAQRYLDISTGGVTEGELAHAKRHVESVRLGEAIQCREMLRRSRPKGQEALDFSSVCPREGDCQRSALCAGQYESGALCDEAKAEAAAEEEQMSPQLVAPRLQIRRLWQLLGVFRDERTVEAVHGYDFNEKDQRRLFLAGAEAARRRCRELGDLLGIDTSTEEMRAKLVRWCTPRLDPKTCACYAGARDKDAPTGIRVCGDEPPPTEQILARCRQRKKKCPAE